MLLFTIITYVYKFQLQSSSSVEIYLMEENGLGYIYSMMQYLDKIKVKQCLSLFCFDFVCQLWSDITSCATCVLHR